MMVIDPIMSNKSAPTVATASSKLVSGDKKPPKRQDSSKRASESLKRNTAKDLKSSKVPRSRSKSPPTRKLSRKKSSKSELKEKKDKKKKKIKQVTADNVMDNSDAASDTTPPFGNNSNLGASSTHSESNKKTPKRSRSSKGVKKALRDSSTSSVADHLKNNDISGGSEHTQSTKTSDSTESTTKDISDKGNSRKMIKKPLEKTTSKKGLKKKSSQENSPKPPPSPRNRVLSFESIHGRSIHKPKTRRSRGNSEGADKYIATLAPPPPSPQPQHAILGSSQPTGAKKKSVLKAKKEKQELERRAKNGECIQEVLGSVNSSTPETNSRKSIGPPIRDSSDEDNFVDPDECSSQSSSCSVVSDGSYEKDYLFSHASDPSEERDLLDENPSFGQHSITVDDDHDLSPTKVSPNEKALNPDESNLREEAFSDSLMGTMASSMPALTEVNEDESSMTSPETSVGRKMPKKPLLKNIPESTPISGGKVRMMPKRAKSDITSLGRMARNTLEIRLPGQRKTITRQRSLTFNEKVRVKRIPCQAQICGGDTSDLWFQPQEYDAIKRKTMALIRAVQDDQTGGVTYCTRGLERYFSVDAVQEKRNDAWDSVLDEQEAQRSNQEEFSAERLSRAYSLTTRLSVQEAMERGKLDEDAIARYTKKMRQTLRRTYSNAV